ncbi:hypothetical protein AB0K09_19970 [Streptomyces sp. NPDC049577]|uniref:hypothetical protein n=1 Tax=Streptomyces sp. NPDC049577 TaxID=3155153 RepID=UPI003423FD91
MNPVGPDAIYKRWSHWRRRRLRDPTEPGQEERRRSGRFSPGNEDANTAWPCTRPRRTTARQAGLTKPEAEQTP